MKKYLLLFTFVIIFICFFSCERKENVMNESNIVISSGIYSNKDWDKFEFPFSAECIPDSETAIAVTKSIVMNFQKEGKFCDYAPQLVFFDVEDNIWIVSFWPKIEGYIGSGFNIAIRKENAQVVKM